MIQSIHKNECQYFHYEAFEHEIWCIDVKLNSLIYEAGQKIYTVQWL